MAQQQRSQALAPMASHGGPTAAAARTTLRVGVDPTMIGLPPGAPITVELPRDTPTADLESLALNMARQQASGATGGLETLGARLPAGQGGEIDASAILAAVPQLAGLVGQFTPAGGTLKGAMAIPGLAELVRQVVTGEEISTDRLLGEAGQGLAGYGLGKAIDAVGRFGLNGVKQVLFGNGQRMTPVEEVVLPQLAVTRKAKLVNEFVEAGGQKPIPQIPGSVDDILRQSVKADQGHLPKGKADPALQELSDQLMQLAGLMEQARRGGVQSGGLRGGLAGGGAAHVAGLGLGLPQQVSALLSAPIAAVTGPARRKLAFRSALAAPFGVPMDQISNLVEAMARGGMAVGDVGTAIDQGPRRRSR